MNESTMSVLKRELDYARECIALEVPAIADHERKLAGHRDNLARLEAHIAELEEDIAKAESGV